MIILYDLIKWKENLHNYNPFTTDKVMCPFKEEVNKIKLEMLVFRLILDGC
jgi:hypothetical protein